MNTLVCIVGPTAVGKSALALSLASDWKTHIISADARQMYRGLDIGTAKVTAAEQAQVPHHFIDSLSPDQSYDAARFAADVEALLQQLWEKHQVVVMVGGSTLYMQALWYGFDEMPKVAPAIREQLNTELREKGLPELVDELRQVDPITFKEVDRKNPVRVIRALEVYRASGKPISSFRKGRSLLKKPYKTVIIGLEDDRERLYARIDRRVEEMLAEGLEAEVKGLLKQGYGANAPAMRSIGYQEWFPYMEGSYEWQEVKRLIQRNSRRYAKRQFTFFRRFEEITWFPAEDTSEVHAWLAQQIS